MTVLVFGFLATQASARCVTVHPSSKGRVGSSNYVGQEDGSVHLFLPVRLTH